MVTNISIKLFNQFDARIVKAEKINTHGGSLRVYVKKDKNSKIDSSVKSLLAEEDKFGLKSFSTYKKFAEKIYIIQENVKKNIKNLKSNGKKLIGYGSPAKATTALNFFGVSSEIEFIVEDNKLKHGKFVPGVNIPIVSKDKIEDKNNTILVLAWNFYEDIKKNNTKLSDNFVSIKDLEK